MLKLNDDQKYGLFKTLANKNLFDAGVEFGFDRYYKDNRAVRNAVYRVYTEVKNNPDKFSCNKEIYDLVVNNITNRAVAKRSDDLKLRDKMNLEDKDIKTIILDNRNKTMNLISRKLDMISSSRNRLAAISLAELAKVGGILFDKGQIIQGEATEHIAHLAKIDQSLSPSELLEAVILQRESSVNKNGRE